MGIIGISKIGFAQLMEQIYDGKIKRKYQRSLDQLRYLNAREEYLKKQKKKNNIKVKKYNGK